MASRSSEVNFTNNYTLLYWGYNPQEKCVKLCVTHKFILNLCYSLKLKLETLKLRIVAAGLVWSKTVTSVSLSLVGSVAQR